MSQVDRGRHTLAEIAGQPEAWAATIDIAEARSDALRRLLVGIDEVAFTGCGSGLNAASAIAPTFQTLTGIRARAVPAAEVVFFPEGVFAAGSRYLLAALSRSGATTETVLAADAARSRGMRTLAITCDGASPLAQNTTEALVLEAAAEQSVATTRSLTSMVLAGQMLSGIVAWQGGYLAQLRKLPELGQKIVRRCEQVGRAIGSDSAIVKFAAVGSGPFFGLARESQLKLKEMTLLPSDSYPLLDYRHGPRSNVDEGMLVIVLTSDAARAAEVEFLHEMKGLRGNLLVLCERADGDIRAQADQLVEVESGLPDHARGVLYMPAVQYLACYRALALGLDPDRPRNLDYWVKTESMG